MIFEDGREPFKSSGVSYSFEVVEYPHESKISCKMIAVSADGRATFSFGLPDRRKRVPSSMAQGGYFIATEGVFPQRS